MIDMAVPLCDICPGLRAQIEELEAEVAQLRAVLAPKVRFPAEWELTVCESAVLSALVARELATAQQIELAVDNALGGSRASGAWPRANVYIFKLRNKLEPHGIEIHNRHGFGWFISQETSASLSLVMSVV